MQKYFKPYYIAVTIIAIGLIGGAIFWLDHRTKQPEKNSSESQSQSQSPGENIPKTADIDALDNENRYIVEVWAESGETEINVAEAKITYPKDTLRVASYTPGEAFQNDAQAKSDQGNLSLIRYTQPGTGVKGKQLIATVFFEKLNEQKPELAVASGSGLYRTGDAVNILTDGQGSIQLIVAD